MLSFGIESESRLPFFIADGADDCAIAVEFRRFTVNALLLVTCKAALALRRRGGESIEFPTKHPKYIHYYLNFRHTHKKWLNVPMGRYLPLREFNALRLVPVDVRSDLTVSLVVVRKSAWFRDFCVRSVCEFFLVLLSV